MRTRMDHYTRHAEEIFAATDYDQVLLFELVEKHKGWRPTRIHQVDWTTRMETIAAEATARTNASLAVQENANA